MSLAHRPIKPGAPLTGLIGALMGDALGVPFEFKTATQLPHINQIDFELPVNFIRSHPFARPYCWSDDGSQLLCFAESLIASGVDAPLNLDRFGLTLLRWRDHAYHQAGGLVFDCGSQTDQALNRLRTGVPACKAGLNSGLLQREPNGNGALMRALAAVIVPAPEKHLDKLAVRNAMAQSLPTHGYPLSQVTCGLLALWGRRLRRGTAPNKALLQETLSLFAEFGLSPDQKHALSALVKWGQTEMPTGGGYVADSFWSAALAVQRGKNYLSTVQYAVGMGNDTDTTACIAGGLAALVWGLDSVPSHWWTNLVVPPESSDLLNTISLL